MALIGHIYNIYERASERHSRFADRLLLHVVCILYFAVQCATTSCSRDSSKKLRDILLLKDPCASRCECGVQSQIHMSLWLHKQPLFTACSMTSSCFVVLSSEPSAIVLATSLAKKHFKLVRAYHTGEALSLCDALSIINRPRPISCQKTKQPTDHVGCALFIRNLLPPSPRFCRRGSHIGLNQRSGNSSEGRAERQ